MAPLLLVAVCLASASTAQTARAQDLCSNIDYVIEQSKSQFAAISGEPDGDFGDKIATFALPDASRCVVATRSRKASYQCSWDYPYRDERAYDSFENLVAGLSQCLGDTAEAKVDQGVNHPDFYDSRRYEMDQSDVTVSVKDKGALGSTFVFIRIDGYATTD